MLAADLCFFPFRTQQGVGRQAGVVFNAHPSESRPGGYR
jgi:hypothetical protein